MRNKTQWPNISWMAIIGLALGTFACEEKASTEAQQAEQPAEVAQKPAPKAQVKPASVKQEEAPAVDTSWQLTDARRAAIESAVVDAKGFLDAQQQLSAAEPADSAAALKTLDTIAKGKWLLIIGSVSKVSDNGVEISLASSDSAQPNAAQPSAAQPSTAQPAADKAAAKEPSKAASMATLSVTKIDAFKKDAYQVDQKVAVLAKYNGSGKAEPAYDLVAMGKWQQAAAAAAQPGAAQAAPAAGNPSPAAQGAAAPAAAPAAPAPATKPAGY
jgi:hypothetical protein